MNVALLASVLALQAAAHPARLPDRGMRRPVRFSNGSKVFVNTANHGLEIRRSSGVLVRALDFPAFDDPAPFLFNQSYVLYGTGNLRWASPETITDRRRSWDVRRKTQRVQLLDRDGRTLLDRSVFEVGKPLCLTSSGSFFAANAKNWFGFLYGDQVPRVELRLVSRRGVPLRSWSLGESLGRLSEVLLGSAVTVSLTGSAKSFVLTIHGAYREAAGGSYRTFQLRLPKHGHVVKVKETPVAHGSLHRIHTIPQSGGLKHSPSDLALYLK